MIHITAHGRLGKDAEVRYLADGTAVAQLNIGCNHSRKGKDGTKPATWVVASLWGKQAEALAPYLLKGKEVVAIVEDATLREWKSDRGSGTSLEGRVLSITLAGGTGSRDDDASPQRQQAEPRAQRQAPAPQRSAPRGQSFDDMDDDIPF